jgi:hypothetical protein
MASDDPEFEKKAARIIGLYLKPPAHTAVFFVDEKSATQALDRLDPVLLRGEPNVTDSNTFATHNSFSLCGLEHGHRRSPGQDS